MADEPEEMQEEAEAPQRLTPQEARPAMEAYKRLYYDNNFSYLNDPANREFYLGDILKQLPVGRRSMLDLGGEYRLRDMHEFNFRGLNLTGQSDDFLLQRTRFYGNLKLDDGLRLYGEALDSATSFQRHAPLASEENGIEALNLFAPPARERSAKRAPYNHCRQTSKNGGRLISAVRRKALATDRTRTKHG